MTGIVYKRRISGEAHRIELEGIFVQIGLLPNTAWLRGTIQLSSHGETSLPGVFAAGDATPAPYKQIFIAMGDGAKASLSAFDCLIRASAPARTARKLLPKAGAANDQPTIDVLTQRLDVHEKTAWMLRSLLEN